MKLLKLFIAILLNFAPFVHGQGIGVRAQSLGGAIRAQGSSNDILYYNPAGLLKYRRVSTDIDYLFDAQTRSHRVGATVVDSATGPWALGFGYAGRLVGADQNGSHLLSVGMAMPIISDMFCLGASVNYTFDKNIGPQPLAHFFNFDLGFLANFPYGMSFAVVADHIVAPKGQEKALGLSLATAFDLGAIVHEIPLSWSFDWVMNDISSHSDLDHRISTALQYVAVEKIPFRLGFSSLLKEDSKLLSLGSGFYGQALSLDVLYQQNLALGKNRYFGFALRYNL